MANKYEYTITKTYNYYGYPEARRSYKVLGDYSGAFLELKLEWYGNHGWDIPTIVKKEHCNGYFWEMKPFVKAMFNGQLDMLFNSLKEQETKVLVIDLDNEKIYWKGE